MPALTTRQRLIKKLQWTFQVEGMNAFMFFGILIFLNASYRSINLLFLSYGMLLMCFILMQGTYYWWLKLSVINERPIFQRTSLLRFRKFKRINQIGLALIPLVLLIQWVISGKQLSGDNFLFWAIFANVFAVLEYINYYHKQLMYDNSHDLKYLFYNKTLKEASLHKDLRENKI